MPRIRTKRTRPPPEGFAKIEPTLEDFEERLKEINKQKDSKLQTKSNENLWKIMQINHERSRYIYKLFYSRKAISRELYDWLLKEKYADKFLIAKWKKKGYEKLCCLKCIQSDETNSNKTCICRVPRAQLEHDAESKNMSVTFQQCVHCGCRGCASTD
ncbi:U2 snRNP complex subunit BUD31 NDAI_0I00420 [Naumovozyma dairenensis CBS 421]|uniref:Pre-mRNA-splicing factor BUD31 n=1 Tax=Naumovozyma dairenensis (strain ATCC 10597 / BCRC 20456 / CBS 421 / NBRC 0211 / NRRL Y-12639) TaxID=1071378 RepID=G0WFQ0_NAUDC|nr:hypothetical protein NDAI_0I00420 [Naumovozyma dairenensis CBS 421]CCD26611.1 hypothetical protein NDAI_0I00420 [Naumovozyma dairenensis CBS 421]